MRKKEYIHIHALLAEVTRHLIENETMRAEMLASYNTLEANPASIHKSKQNHREAIMALSSAIEPCLKRDTTESHKQPVKR